MAATISGPVSCLSRIAVVTRGARGLGLGICKQLASNGVKVVLTDKDEEKGLDAVEKLKQFPHFDITFHHLNVTDSTNISSLSEFIKTKFKKLDILVNNAAVPGGIIDREKSGILSNILTTGETYERAEECVSTIYYGTKTMTETFIPLLLSSHSPRICIPNKSIQKEIGDIDNLTEEKIDGMVRSFLSDFKEGDLRKNDWPTSLLAYIVSKVAVSAYTRLVAKRYPAICTNYIHPGFVRTEMTGNLGALSAEEAARGPVMLALLPDGSPSGLFYDQTEVSSFTQLASTGVRVILTARDEKRGLEAAEKLKQSGLSDVIFHRLDVTDSSGIASFAEFVKISFGKLDILVNCPSSHLMRRGVTIDAEILNNLNIESEKKTRSIVMDFLSNLKQNYEMGEECLKTNFYGTRDVTQALIPLLLSSNSGRIQKLRNLRSIMAATIGGPVSCLNRIAVVTGGARGLGLRICKQLASNGVKVILTDKDEEKGLDAVAKLKQFPHFDVTFHHLNVMNSTNIASLSDFIKTTFKKLDILVNNAGVAGGIIDHEKLKVFDGKIEKLGKSANPFIIGETYERAEECVSTNYYGTKTMTETFIPLLLSSQSPRIVNVTSLCGKLQYIPNQSIQKEIGDIDNLTEGKIDEMVRSFLSDFKEGNLRKNNWPTSLSAYIVSKVAVSAYTRLIAKRYPAICTNCIHPGFVRTDITGDLGTLSAEEAAKGPVMLALLPDGSPSGLFYDQTEVSSFTQLASSGVRVILTARDEKRGLEAAEKLKQSGLSDVIFHRLDVTDPSGIALFAEFVKISFGKLDILRKQILFQLPIVECRKLDAS
ncbi:(+)-neomenthol dehydrogenase [Ananas comosus]|uniref:(+)-neomenthol dehydrogenase n=1 Tax=Ananas comosus TaxID=4615 RepID=A0A199W0Y8_ANACO|nr:(+)-neomenthol dehydrogenase [Ananas comosus]